jgi:perosamine synthetase
MLKRDYIKTKNIEILPITEKISEQVLTLPMYPNMENEEKEYLIDSVSQFFEINS